MINKHCISLISRNYTLNYQNIRKTSNDLGLLPLCQNISKILLLGIIDVKALTFSSHFRQVVEYLDMGISSWQSFKIIFIYLYTCTGLDV